MLKLLKFNIFVKEIFYPAAIDWPVSFYFGYIPKFLTSFSSWVSFRKGISKFYNGKSKSFTSLADASSTTSVQEIVKPEDPYAKKRKNLLAHNMFIDRSHNRSNNSGGTSKRSANLGRGASCIALSSSSSSTNSSEGNSASVSPPSCLPPLHPQAKRLPAIMSQTCPPRTSWRSYSWSDLQSATVEAHDLSGLAVCSGDKGNKLH